MEYLLFAASTFLLTAQARNVSKVVSLMDPVEQRQHLAEAQAACFRRMKYSNSSPSAGWDSLQCPMTWDNILCWSQAPAGSLQIQTCPDYVHGFDTRRNATRFCTENGTWFINPRTNNPWTNYLDCVNLNIKPVSKEHAGSLKLLYTVGYGVSLASLIIAVIIMCCCRRLKSKSNTLHVNLFLAFILRAALSFTKDTLFVEHLGFTKDVQRTAQGTLQFVPNATHWECRTLMSLFVYSICVSHMWIFMEGLYLHMLIYSTLSTERRGVRLYVLMGWLSPLLFFIPWVISKSTLDGRYCWTVSSKPNLMWIYNGPLMATVILNFMFFLNILRVLVLRVRSADRHIGRQQQYRQLAKFILVLVPLFGLLHIVFYVVFPVVTFSDKYDIVHLFLEMTYSSFQGFILALLFCFLNEEVHAEIRRMWMRKKSLRRDSMALTRSFALSSFRKPSIHSRGHGSMVLHGGPLDSNQLARQQQHNVHLAKSCSDSSSDARSEDWLLVIKRRALVIFWRKKSSDSREGVIDTRYDCDSVPDIDADTRFVCNGSGDGMLELVGQKSGQKSADEKFDQVSADEKSDQVSADEKSDQVSADEKPDQGSADDKNDVDYPKG